MTTNPPPAPPAPPADPPADPEPGRIHSLDALAGQIQELFNLVKGGSGKPASGKPGKEEDDVAAQVRAELEKLKAETDAKEAGEATMGRIGKLEEALKSITERKPKEHRWFTKMLWGDKSDDE